MFTVLLYFLLGLGVGALAALVVCIGKIVMSALAKRMRQLHGKFVIYWQIKKFEKEIRKKMKEAEWKSLEDLFAKDGIKDDDIMEIQHDGENFHIKSNDLHILDSKDGIDENFLHKLNTHEFLNVKVAN